VLLLRVLFSLALLCLSLSLAFGIEDVATLWLLYGVLVPRVLRAFGLPVTVSTAALPCSGPHSLDASGVFWLDASDRSSFLGSCR